MGNLYYSLWVDAIMYERTNHAKLRDWKFYTLIPISIGMGINMLTLFMLIGKFFNVWILSFVNIDLFPIANINKALSGVVILFLPFIFINYLLIFYKGQYKRIVKIYPYRKGRVYKAYFISSLALLIIPLIIIVLFFQ